MSSPVLKCTAYRDGGLICRNGFPQNAYCSGYTCHGCGRPAQHIPLCLQDDGLPPHLFDDAGLPRLSEYRRSAA